MTFLPLCLLGALLLVDSAIAQAPSAPTTLPQNYAFTVRSPSGCAPSSCTIFAGVNLNQNDSDYVDIYLEGQAQGYVAVGFTATPNMFSADVVACTRDANNNNMVRALDSWNAASPGRANQRDPTMEEDLEFHGGEFVGGRIRCTVSKRIIGSDENHDVNLNSDLNIIYASGNTVASPTDLIQHNILTGVSADTFSFPPIAATDPPMSDITTMDDGTTLAPPIFDSLVDPQNVEYRLTGRVPPGCSRPECDIFFGISTNNGSNDFLDIYLEGEAGSWVAVGFSEESNMFSADVVGCVRDSMIDNVVALDTQNAPSPSRGNIIDAQGPQNFVMFNTSMNGSRISCFVAKAINSGNNGDFDLNDDFYVLLARRQANSESAVITMHLPNERFVSTNRFKPARDSGEVDFVGISDLRHALTRVHGILMLIAWMLLFLPGIYFSTWMKWILPNGEWFQVHRALVIGALFVALLGFMLIFIANKDNATPGLIDLSSGAGRTHFGFGITLMALMITNPIIALFRCKPDHKYRWIFRVIHGNLIGRVTESFSMITISFGLSIFSQNFAGYSNNAAFWLYIAFVIFYVIFVIVNVIEIIVAWKMGAFKECESKKSKDTELQTRGEEKKLDPDVKERKPPAKDALPRWILFAILLAVLVPVLIALIVLVALPPE